MIVFLILATVAKLVAAAVVGGTADIDQQLYQARAFLAGRDVFDPVSTGNNPSFFPVGHYAITVVALTLSEVTAVAFAVWIKVPAILADLAVSLLLRSIPRGGASAAVAYMANPVTLLLSTYHGQLHTVATAAAVLAVWLTLRDRPVAGGLVLGLAASVRQHFIMLVVPLASRSARDGRVVATAALGALVMVNAPLLWSAHPERVLSPTSTYGIWGYSILLRQWPRMLTLAGLGDRDIPASADRALATYGGALLWVWALAFVFWAFRRRPDVWRAALLFVIGVYVVSPGFGVQWLIWAVPFWLVVDFRGALSYSALAGVFLAGTYWVWGFNVKYGVESVTANLRILSALDLATYLGVGLLGVAAWLYCAWSAWRLLCGRASAPLTEDRVAAGARCA